MSDAPPELARWRWTALLVGAAGLGVCAAAALALPFGTAHFFRAWLVAFNVFTGVALGSLVVVMLQYVTGGQWGWVLRPTLEAASRTLPLMALLFVPLAFGMDYVYEWSRFETARADHEFVKQDLYKNVDTHDHELEHKLPYLNRGFFFVRAGICFALWILIAWLLSRWAAAKTPQTDAAATLSAPGLLLYMGTVSFAAVDWGMSLEPRWYSTIYGAMFGMGQVLAGFAVCILVFLAISKRPDLDRAVAGQNMSDLGTLLGAFIMIWAYLSFMQFLIIWMGQLPEENVWYVARMMHDPWRWVALALVVLHFVVPFAALMTIEVKRNRSRLMAVALLVCVMRVVDVVWLLVPAFGRDGSGVEPAALSAFVLYPAALAGIGGLWFAAFFWQLGNRPLLPIHSDTEDASHGQAAAH